jgi:hypothetical protein
MTKRSTPDPLRPLRNALYDELVKTISPKSKFYDADCADVWAAVLRKDAEQLRSSLAFWRGVATVSAADMRRHCDTRGLF